MSLLAEDGRVTLALGELADLFSDPVPDPLAGRFRTTSGIEDLVSRLDARSAGPLHLEIGVERGAAGPDEAARAKRALEGCCAERIETLEVRRHQVERLGRKELAFGLVFLAACLAAASGLAAGTLGPDWLRDFLRRGPGDRRLDRPVAPGGHALVRTPPDPQGPAGAPQDPVG
jgi:hypothetical protein